MFFWFKFLHLFFVISWFAGLFYLPRIFVNLAQTEVGSGEYVRLSEMARRLYRFMRPLGFGTVIFGTAAAVAADWTALGWVHLKLAAGLGLLVYQWICARLLLGFERLENRFSHKWYRVFNEVPVLVMAAALYAVVFKFV